MDPDDVIAGKCTVAECAVGAETPFGNDDCAVVICLAKFIYGGHFLDHDTKLR